MSSTDSSSHTSGVKGWLTSAGSDNSPFREQFLRAKLTESEKSEQSVSSQLGDVHVTEEDSAAEGLHEVVPSAPSSSRQETQIPVVSSMRKTSRADAFDLLDSPTPDSSISYRNSRSSEAHIECDTPALEGEIGDQGAPMGDQADRDELTSAQDEDLISGESPAETSGEHQHIDRLPDPKLSDIEKYIEENCFLSSELEDRERTILDLQHQVKDLSKRLGESTNQTRILQSQVEDLSKKLQQSEQKRRQEQSAWEEVYGKVDHVLHSKNFNKHALQQLRNALIRSRRSVQRNE